MLQNTKGSLAARLGSGCERVQKSGWSFHLISDVSLDSLEM